MGCCQTESDKSQVHAAMSQMESRRKGSKGAEDRSSARQRFDAVDVDVHFWNLRQSQTPAGEGSELAGW